MRNQWLIGLFITFIIAVGLIGAASLPAQEEAAEGKADALPLPESTMKPVYVFQDAQELEQFKQLIAAKQLINTRMAVLNSYLMMEQSNLDQIDVQLYLKYNFYLEANKRYDLDEATMTLQEIVE